MNLLQAEQLTYYVKDRVLIDHADILIQDEDKIGLIGRNGAGKTSLLELLAGKRKPDSGLIQRYGTLTLLPQLKEAIEGKSGGEIAQEFISRALAANPAILLADEPTTHLDASHMEALEKRLNQWQGALVLISHDRSFLDAVCTEIWELEDGVIHAYKGNYTSYKKQKELEKQQQAAAYEQYEQKKKQLKRALELKEEKAARATKTPKNVTASEARITGSKPYFANKQKKLRKAAKALETRLEKLEIAEKAKEMPAVKMTLPNTEKLNGKTIFRFRNAQGFAGSKLLWKAQPFDIKAGDKVAIIGPNGSGKTTLLQKIIHQNPDITSTPAVKIGYFSQNIDALSPEDTILENVKASSVQSETFVRTTLARLHFYGDDVHKQVHLLSGGERVKTAFAKIFSSDINTLLLDEPTSHLDIAAVEALETLIKTYEGTVLFVSHDRRFIHNLATKILIIQDHRLKLFDGNYEAYLAPKTTETPDDLAEQKLALETKITEVLSRLSLEPSAELEQQFQQLLDEKKRLHKQKD